MKHDPAELSLSTIMAKFSSLEQAREYLEGVRWPQGARCPRCEGREVWKLQGNPQKHIRQGLYHCVPCDRQFTVTVGTIFEDSHIPLHKWLVAWFLFATAKKGISALQMQRTLDLGSYRTAWFLMHRIRHAIASPDFNKPLEGTVEVDETYIGGKEKRPKERRLSNKTAVVSLVERGGLGRKKSMVMPHVTAKNLKQAIRDHVAPGTTINTDDASKFAGVAKEYPHATVNHRDGQYVRKFKDGHTVTTNTVEGSFSLLKRGIVGAFHHVSRKHLHRYVEEFDHRWNTRKDTDGERTVSGLKQAEGKRLTYKPLVGTDGASPQTQSPDRPKSSGASPA